MDPLMKDRDNGLGKFIHRTLPSTASQVDVNSVHKYILISSYTSSHDFRRKMPLQNTLWKGKLKRHFLNV